MVSERGEPAVSAEPVHSGSGCQWSVSVESLQYPLIPCTLGRDVSERGEPAVSAEPVHSGSGCQ